MATGMAIFVTGMFTGIVMHAITSSAVQRRVETMPSCFYINGDNAQAIWAALGGLAWLWTYLTFGFSLQMVEILFALCACLMLSAVDFCIRLIPNPMLIALFAGEFVFLYIRNGFADIPLHLLGSALGAVIFLLPCLIKQQAGMGDVKLSATIGFYLGVYHTIAALAIMSVLCLLYTAYLVITRKGTLKTMVSLGPYLSAGFIIALALWR